MEKLNLGNAMVVGKRNPKVKEVVDILSEHFSKIMRNSELSYSIESYPDDHFNLIVVTDSLDNDPDRDFIANLRKKSPQAKVIGLFDKINRGVEINMRSVGLIFLGSYDHFSENSPHIFRSAFRAGGARSEK